MSEQTPEQPIKWLLNELRAYLNDDQYTSLMTGYDRVKRRYDTAAKLRTARQELALFRRNQSRYTPDKVQYKSYGVKIERRLARIKMLEAELAKT